MSFMIDQIYVKASFKDYIFMFCFLCFCGNPLFTTGPYAKPLLIVYVTLFICISNVLFNNPAANRVFNQIFKLAIIIFVISLCQYVLLGFLSYPGIFAIILKLSFAALLFLYYKKKQISFFDLYIRILPPLVLLSLPFFALNFVVHQGLPLENTLSRSMFFYTSYELNEYQIRNSGMFWEPGAFAGYLNLGLVFVVLQNKRFLIGKYATQVLGITFGIITTMSTMGYSVLACIGFVFILESYPKAKYLLLPAALFLGSVGYNNLDFLSEKIESQFDEASEMSKEDVSNQRFGALRMDLQYIADSPIVGNGLNFITRYRFHPWIDEDIGHGNGMSNFIVWWGLPFFLYWLIWVFRYAKKALVSNTTAMYIAFLLLLLLQGEQFLSYPLFLFFYIAPSLDYDRYENSVF